MGKTYIMVNTWLRNCRSILALMKKEIKGTKRERDWEEDAWRTAEQFPQLKVHYFC